MKFKVGLITPFVVFTHLKGGLTELSNLADNRNTFLLTPWPNASLFVVYVDTKPNRSKAVKSNYYRGGFLHGLPFSSIYIFST